jgi:hypothetical protein
MSEEYPDILSIGDHVTYIDGDGDEHRAVVVSTCPDADYISVVTSEQGQLGNDYTYSVETHTSVHPHPDEWDGPSAVETYAYKTGWP